MIYCSRTKAFYLLKACFYGSHHSRTEAPEAERVHKGLGAGASVSVVSALRPAEEALGVGHLGLDGPGVGLLQGHPVVLSKPAGTERDGLNNRLKRFTRIGEKSRGQVSEKM